MKTKKIFKIFTIITMLMLAIFTTGCESQQEKYSKASNDLIVYVAKTKEELNAITNKIEKNEKNTNQKEGIEPTKEYIRKADEFEKNLKEKVENLQKIAKGNPQLENDIRLKIKSINQEMFFLRKLNASLKQIIKK